MPLTDKQKRYYEILGERNRLRQERLSRARLSSEVKSVSSNKKWEKIFSTLQFELDSRDPAVVKLLKQEDPWEYNSILSSVFEESYLDGQSGPLKYSEIEWIEFPCVKLPAFNFEVDLEIGKGFVVIYGYRRNNS